METSELLSLWPLVVATLTPMAGFALALVGFMHRDMIKIRDVIGHSDKEHRELLERSSKENRELIERSNKESRKEFAEHKRVTEENHRTTQQQLGKINDSLADTRERLARIEGHLSASPDRSDLRRPQPEAEADG